MKTLTALYNWFRGVDDTTAAKLANPERDGKLSIEDAKKEVAEFTSKIAELMASTRLFQSQLDHANQDVQKYENLAVSAGKMQQAADVTQALILKAKATKMVETLTKQVAAHKELETSLRAQLDDRNEAIANAKDNLVLLSTTLHAAELRKRVANAANGIGGEHSGLAALGDLEKATDQAVAEADVAEELAGAAHPAQALEKKYASISIGVSDAEISRYMSPAPAAPAASPATGN